MTNSVRSAVMRAYWSRRNEWNCRTSNALRWRMITLHLRGVPIRAIANLVDCHRSTIQYWVNRWKAQGTATVRLECVTHVAVPQLASIPL